MPKRSSRKRSSRINPPLVEFIEACFTLAWTAGWRAAQTGYLLHPLNSITAVSKIMEDQRVMERLQEPVKKILNRINAELGEDEETYDDLDPRLQPSPYS